MEDSDSYNEYDFNEDEYDSNYDGFDQVGDGEESDPLASDDDGRRPRNRASSAVNETVDDELFGPAIDDLMVEAQSGGRRRRRRRIDGRTSGARNKASVIPSHLKPMMGSANMAFISKDYDRAEELLTQIIAEAPRAAAPLRTLGLIYESRGWQEKTLECFMQAAKSERTDSELWKRNAAIWKEKGHLDNAIKCLSQALVGPNSQDVESLKARAHLYVRKGKLKNAADSYIKALHVDAFDIESARAMVKCLTDANDIARADDALDEVTAECEQQFAISSGQEMRIRERIVIQLLELCTEVKMKQQRYVEANMLLVRLRGRSTAATLPLTFKQRLMIAICQHRLGSDVLAAPVFQEFMSSFAEMDKHRFLLWQVADACHDSGHYHLAADAFSTLIEMKDEEPIVDKFLRRALCYKEVGHRQGAKDDLQKVLSIQPRHVVASLHIQEFLPKIVSSHKRRKRGARGPTSRFMSKERIEALDVLGKANALFDSGDYEGYLLHIYVPLDTALELRSPLRLYPSIRRIGRKTSVKYFSSFTKDARNHDGGEEADRPSGNDGKVEDEGLNGDKEQTNKQNDSAKLADVNQPNKVINQPSVYNSANQPSVENNIPGVHSTINVSAINLNNLDEIQPVVNSSQMDIDTNSKSKPTEDRNFESESIAPRQPTKQLPKQNFAPQRRWEQRRPPFDKHKQHRVGATLMMVLDHEMFVEIAERVTISFRALGELEMAHRITRVFHSLAHLRVSSDEKLRRKLRNLDLVTSVASGAIWRAYDQARHLLHDCPTDADLLHVFTVVELLCEAETDASGLRNRSYRGLARILKKNPNSAFLSFVMANVSSRGGLNVQRYTVGFYLAALKLAPRNPLVCLCLGVQVLYVAMGRRIINRNEAMPHALTFLQCYRRYRRQSIPSFTMPPPPEKTTNNETLQDESQAATYVSNDDEDYSVKKVVIEMETDYNIARAMHQIGIVDAACNMYERVLKHPEGEKVPEWADMRRESAFNLMHIFKNSGSQELASKVCNEFLVF